MKKTTIWGAVLGIIGAILTLTGGITKHAYSTGYSYVVTAAEEQAAIGKAEACIFIGIAMVVVAFIIFLKGSIKKDQ